MKLHKVVIIGIILLASVIRIFGATDNPPGLYIDEISIGNNAYAILTRGVDEHGERYPLFFKAFGEYKLPVYIYLSSFSMVIFDKTELAVRFPSIFFGSMTILVLYFFVSNLLAYDKNISAVKRRNIAILSAGLLAITPWHIHFSRGGFEATVALFFYLTSLTFALMYIRNKRRFLFILLSILAMSATVYTYNAYRIIAPMTIIFLSIWYVSRFPSGRKHLFISLGLFAIVLLPMAFFSLSPSGSERFAQTSVFQEVKVGSQEEKVIRYPLAVLNNYLSYYSLNFLFDTGDGIGRHQLPNFGPLFKWQLPFLLLGLYALAKIKNTFVKAFILFLFLLAPLPAAFSVPSPHTLRALLLVIPATLICVLGIVHVYQLMTKYHKFAIMLLLVIVFYEFSLYMHFYSVHYPKVNDLDWGGGYKEMLLKAQEIEPEYDFIIYENKFSSLPYYYSFYRQDNDLEIVGSDWVKPAAWEGKKVLYVRPYYGPANEHVIVESTLPHDKGHIFSQFWSL